MMKFMLCREESAQVGGEELLQHWRNDSTSWIWIDLFEENTEDEQNFLNEAFSLDNKSISEAQRTRHLQALKVLTIIIFYY